MATASDNPSTPSLTLEQAVGYDKVFLFLRCWFDPRSLAGFVRLALLAAIPTGLSGLAALNENRFYLGSVTTHIEGVGTVLGMSFLGDTMVWPFALLVPLLLVLLIVTVDRSRKLLNGLFALVFARSETEVEKTHWQAVFNRVRRILTGRQQGSSFRWGFLPWVVALLFWSYNTLTCAFNPELPGNLYPYTAQQVLVIGAKGEAAEHHLATPVALPKWDTDRHSAPWSAWITRLWTLIFYGLPPFLLYRLVLSVLAVLYFLREFGGWAQQQPVLEHNKPLIQPFSADGYGGLRYIADTGMGFFYTTMGLVFLVLMAFFKEGPQPSWHNYLLIVALMPIALYVLIAPTVAIRNTILQAKTRYLDAISQESNRIFRAVMRQEKREGNNDHSRASLLNTYYDQVQGMPVWPFSVSALTRIILTILAPLFAMFGELLVKFLIAL